MENKTCPQSLLPCMLLQPLYNGKAQSRQCVEFEYLAGFISRRFSSARVMDAQFENLSIRECAIILRDAPVRVLYLHIETSLAFRAARRLLEEDLANPVVILGGDFIQTHGPWISTLDLTVHALITGETEYTLDQVVACAVEGRDWQEEPGLYVVRNGQLAPNPPRALPDDLSHLKAPLYSFFDDDRVRKGHRVLFGRGCHDNCSYCGLQTPYRRAFPGVNRFWRTRESGDILEEIVYCAKNKDVRRFYFNSHVVLGYDEKGTRVLEEVAEGIIREGLRIRFSFVSHPHHVLRNASIFPLLERAGLDYVTLGIDSGIERVLEDFRAPFNPTDSLGALSILAELGIRCLPVFIFYEPKLEIHEVEENLLFLERLKSFFRHEASTFAMILDQRFLNTSLTVKQGMPIYQKLLEEGLSVSRTPLEKSPPVGFRSPAVGTLFRIHFWCNKRLLPRLRPLMYSPAVVEAFPALNTFPIQMIRTIISTCTARPEDTLEQIGESVTHQLLDPLSGNLPSMLALISDDRERRRIETVWSDPPVGVI